MTAARHLALVPGARHRRERKRRYRARLKDVTLFGMVTIPVTHDVIGMLIDLHWLPVEASEDRSRIADAIARLLNDVAKAPNR